MTQTVLITGASSGIGHAAAHHFSAQGWNVIATLRDPSATGDLPSLPNVLVTRLDVQDPASIDAAIQAGIARFGRIDVLVNNAGYGQFGVFEAISREKIQRQFDVNVFGVMDVTRALLPHLRAHGGGAIVNLSSGAGLFTLPMISLYCASKFALEGFSEALSYELASQGIAVKLVEPHGGVTSTRFNARTAEDAAIADAPTDYQDFVTRTVARFGTMAAASSMSAADVAKVVFLAATDGSTQLRYPVGPYDGGFLQARQTLPEADYMAFMRAKFEPMA